MNDITAGKHRQHILCGEARAAELLWDSHHVWASCANIPSAAPRF
jgi:hypothetical protein